MGRLQKPDRDDAPVRPAEPLTLFAAGAATDGVIPVFLPEWGGLPVGA